MAHNQAAMIKAHQAGRAYARSIGGTRAYANDVAHTLPIDQGDAWLAGYYAETRRRMLSAKLTKPNAPRPSHSTAD
jgi:hypothetical protein